MRVLNNIYIGLYKFNYLKIISMGKHLSRELKQEIQNMKISGYRPKYISESKQIPLKTVYKILNTSMEHGNKKEVEKRGRPKNFQVDEKKLIIREIKKNPNNSLKDIVDLVDTIFKKSICRSTAQNILNDFRFKSYIDGKKPFLSNKNIQNRVKFSKEFFCESIEFWESVIWSDECVFKLDNSAQKRYWSKPFNKNIMPITNPTKKYGSLSVMVWACFSFHGVGRLVVIDDNINSLKYQQILIENLVPSAKMMGMKNFVFQQDNAPAHSSKLIKNFFEKNKIKLLP